MSIHLVIPDTHTHPDHSNERFDWLGDLIVDVKPDKIIHLGDHWDFPSLSSYEVGRRAFNGRNYDKDINHGHDAHERMFNRLRRQKKRRPYSVFLEGNHENRLKKAINLNPELEGMQNGISWRQLDLDRYYHDVVEYEGQTPSTIEIDGVHYAHYFVSGVLGRPIGGEHLAHSLLSKQYQSCTSGHTHTADYAIRTDVNGKRLMGLVAGVYQDYDSDWAGVCNRLWWRGVVIKYNVEGGSYDPRFVSLEQLRKEYKK